jgi:hypothetical protein
MRKMMAGESEWLNGVEGEMHFLLRRIRTMKRLTAIMFALAAYGVPASAASLSTFAYDSAGRSVLEFNPASVFAFSAEGRDLMSVTVTETPPESDPHGPIDLAVIVDCRLRQMAASLVTPVAKDGAPPTTVAGFKTSDLKPPSKGMYERFVVAVCDGELLGVKVSPAKSGWTHFVEGAQRALYFANGSSRTIGKYRAASVRLYELGGTQLPDGRHIDARDAVWVVDCEQKLGAVAYERAFARVGDKNETVESTGDERAFADPSIVEVDKLKFGRAVAGSMQARFSEELCVTNLGSQGLSSAQTKTVNFVYYTIDVPVDWTQVGTGKLQPGDKTLLVTALNLTGIEATAAPEQDAAAMKSLVAEMEKNAIRTLTSQGCKLVQDFSARDIDGQRSLIRGVFQANTGMTVVPYYVEGPTYVVPLLVTGNRDGAATMAEMDPILSSLRWLGKPLERRPSAN